MAGRKFLKSLNIYPCIFLIHDVTPKVIIKQEPKIKAPESVSDTNTSNDKDDQGFLAYA
jgi:hypothetical protein